MLQRSLSQIVDKKYKKYIVRISLKLELFINMYFIILFDKSILIL